MTEAEFFAALQERYDRREWALLPQVRNQTGFSRQVRTADAIAVSLFPSRGIDAHGFEFKDSRTDWLKELKEPAKAEEIGRYCAYWWVVVSGPAIVKKDELPSAWGLMTVADGAVKVATKAPRREAEQPGWPFVAAVLRAAAGYVTGEDEIDRRVSAAVSKAMEGEYQRRQQAVNSAVKHQQQRLEEQAAKLREFEEASGVSLFGRESGRKIGEAVKFVLSGGLAAQQAELDRLIDACDRIRSAAERGKQVA
jgi:hypothetical protein